MALKFRLRGLAETFLDEIQCPSCGFAANDDQHFSTSLTKVTFEGIIVVAECMGCGEIFVPDTQRLGIINTKELKAAVEKDSRDTGEPLITSKQAVVLITEKLNAERRGDLH